MSFRSTFFLKMFVRCDVMLYFGQVFFSAWALSFSIYSSDFMILVSKAVALLLNRDRLLGLYCSLRSWWHFLIGERWLLSSSLSEDSNSLFSSLSSSSWAR